jgi:calcineurin-like phosphoesterase family protein
MNDVFFTSDEHHGHENIRTGWAGQKGAVAPRPFSSLEDMTEGLVERHNARVKPGDLVYHLGDMFWRTFSPISALDVMNRLHGQHYYILGNHEEMFEKASFLKHSFVWVREREKIRPIGGPKAGIVLDHYAGRVWRGSHNGAWQLYGHSHGNLPELDTLLAFDVGVDVNDFAPVSLDEVNQRMSRKVPHV